MSLLFNYHEKTVEDFWEPLSDVNLLCLIDLMVEISLSPRVTNYPLRHGPAAKIDHHKQLVPKGLAQRGLKLNDYNRLRIVAASTLAHYIPADTKTPVVRYFLNGDEPDVIYAEVLDEERFRLLMLQMREQWKERSLVLTHKKAKIKSFDSNEAKITFVKREPYLFQKDLLPYKVFTMLYTKKGQPVTKKEMRDEIGKLGAKPETKDIERTVLQLRTILEDRDRNGIIETVAGGYILHA